MIEVIRPASVMLKMLLSQVSLDSRTAAKPTPTSRMRITTVPRWKRKRLIVAFPDLSVVDVTRRRKWSLAISKIDGGDETVAHRATPSGGQTASVQSGRSFRWCRSTPKQLACRSEQLACHRILNPQHDVPGSLKPTPLQGIGNVGDLIVPGS